MLPVLAWKTGMKCVAPSRRKRHPLAYRRGCDDPFRILCEVALAAIERPDRGRPSTQSAATLKINRPQKIAAGGEWN